MSIPALNAGISGIQLGLNHMRRDASAVAHAVNPDSAQTTNVTSALVNLKADSLQVQASSRVVETVHDLIGSLLDVTA
jgi:hypothetical protein